MFWQWTGKTLKSITLEGGSGFLLQPFPTLQHFTPHDAYRFVPWVRRCVDLRAGAIEHMPFVILRDGKEVSLPPPLTEHLFHSLLGLTERALCLYGAAYWLKVTNRRGGLLTLRWLAPQTIRIKASAKNGLEGFERVIGAETFTFRPDELVYFWEDNYSGEVGPGEPVVLAALNAAWTAYSASVYTGAFFERGGIPPIIISADVLPDEREQLQTWWNSLKQRARNFWRALVISSEVKITQLDIPTGEDLALPSLMATLRNQIAVSFGVPETLLEDAANYATAKEHRRSFYTETILPRCRMLEGVLNEQLFGPAGLEFRFAPERLEIFQQEEAEKAQAVVALVQAGIMTPNEAREQMGLPVREAEKEEAIELLEAGVEKHSLSPQAISDLYYWYSCCEKHGQMVDFQSSAIPAPLAQAIKAIGERDGWEAAFKFLPRYHSLVTKRDPERPQEEELRRRILRILKEREEALLSAVEQGADPVGAINYDDLATALRAALEPVLVEAFTTEALAQMADLGLYSDISGLQAAALEWASSYSYDLVTGLIDTTRQVVQRAISAFLSTPGMTVEDLRKMLEPAFGPVRAEMIAITEVTRAVNQATQIYQQLLKDYGLDMVRIWRTSADEKTCPICQENNGKPEWEWTIPSGPPAHPRCRCWTTLTTMRRRQ